jgi:hypothetical protein
MTYGEPLSKHISAHLSGLFVSFTDHWQFPEAPSRISLDLRHLASNAGNRIRRFIDTNFSPD